MYFVASISIYREANDDDDGDGQRQKQRQHRDAGSTKSQRNAYESRLWHLLLCQRQMLFS